MSTPQHDIARYLATGDYDNLFPAWPGDTLIACAIAGTSALQDALVAEVRRRAHGKSLPAAVKDLDLVAFTRGKVAPMVRGLFPRAEQDAVLRILQGSVVFLTPESIEHVLREEAWLHTAWDLANLYLGSIGAELLAPTAPRLLGMSEETTCYVSVEYFSNERDRFADFIVHEASHVFHNCKRRTAGLPETRTREWLLPIAYRKRETFAYACEAYSRILELGDGAAARQRLLAELAEGPMPNDERVDAAEYLGILREAVKSRNGWKRILGGCAPVTRVRR